MYYILFTRLSDNLQLKLKNYNLDISPAKGFNWNYIDSKSLFATPKQACEYVESYFNIDCYIDDVAHDRKNGFTFQLMKVGLSE
tara:strand:- start:549 stop:800 length:252 start_codon:yes stop_codon:yes gene_type:complete